MMDARKDKKLGVDTCIARNPHQPTKKFEIEKLWRAAIICQACEEIDCNLWPKQGKLMQITGKVQLPRIIKTHQPAIILTSLKETKLSAKRNISPKLKL